MKTPCYVIDEAKLEHNLEILKQVQDDTGCKILLAQKAFSFYPLYPWMGKYLAGTAASGLYEARLGKEEMKKESHVFSGAYRREDMEEILRYSDHVVFNSINQLKEFAAQVKSAGKEAGSTAGKEAGNTAGKEAGNTAGKEVGIRINPECSTQEGHEIYDPCAPGSRLGVIRSEWDRQMTEELLSLVDGLHFHTLCEQGAEELAVTLQAVEDKFGDVLKKMKWINFGGGHHITKAGYRIDILEDCIRKMQEKYGLQVYIEPGEAVALNAGYLYTKVLDVVRNGMDIAILDTSAACHMPDVIEMPYRPPLKDSALPGEKSYTYRLGGPTCLSGDVIGDYSFDTPLNSGDTLIFEDMAIYSMVKNNTFNGMPLPDIVLKHKDGRYETVKQFGYEDFKNRLG